MSDADWIEMWDPFGYLRALDGWWPLQSDLKEQYRSLLLIHHPDKGGKKEDFVLLQSAYAVLSKPQLLAEHFGMVFRPWNEWKMIDRLRTLKRASCTE